MGKVKINETAEITIKGIHGYIERTVTKFGSGAKVDCPKEFLGRRVFLVITNGDKE
jgi:putative transposon-encoded protein